MIRKFVDKVISGISAPPTESENKEVREHLLRLATAVLMIDVARSDHSFDETEFDRLLELVRSHFNLSAEDTADLIVAATGFNLNVTNLTGQTVIFENNINSNQNVYKLNMSNYASGIYFLNIETNGIHITKKLILN